MTATADISPTVRTRAIPLRMSERRLLLAIGDGVLLLAAVVIALWLWTVRGDLAFSAEFLLLHAQWFLILGGLWSLTASLFNFYRPEITANLMTSAVTLLKVTGMMLVIYFVIYSVSPPNSVNRVVVIFFGLLSLTMIASWRALYTSVLHRSMFEQRVLVVGAGYSGQVIARTVDESLDRTYRVLGFVDDVAAATVDEIAGHAVLGATADLPRLTRQYGVSEIVLAQADRTSATLFQALLDCQEQGIQITPMALLYENITGRVPVEHVGDQWYVVLPMDHLGTSILYSAIKRTIDIAVALVGLAVFALLFPIIALAIRLDSPGPIFYRQARVGKGGRIFHLSKLRSMIPDAERDQAVWCALNDARVTRVGRFLRSTRLDELPQLINILKGDMSLVGPRPERPELVAELETTIPFYRARHSVLPGATGWALLHTGYARSVEDTFVKLQYDLYYIKHQSVLLDLFIILKTVITMVTMRGT